VVPIHGHLKDTSYPPRVTLLTVYVRIVSPACRFAVGRRYGLHYLAFFGTVVDAADLPLPRLAPCRARSVTGEPSPSVALNSNLLSAS
jgi:hypothetical protein